MGLYYRGLHCTLTCLDNKSYKSLCCSGLVHTPVAVPFARLNLAERQPLTHFPKVWQNLKNVNIKFIRNKLEFKQKIKEHLPYLAS
jgi:hypothetical protein